MQVEIPISEIPITRDEPQILVTSGQKSFDDIPSSYESAIPHGATTTCTTKYSILPLKGKLSSLMTGWSLELQGEGT